MLHAELFTLSVVYLKILIRTVVCLNNIFSISCQEKIVSVKYLILLKI